MTLEKILNNITEKEIECTGKIMTDICCEQCGYSTGYMKTGDAVFKINMQGGYFKYDGEGGIISECPVCKEDTLSSTW